jgi:hypothetical protein
MPEENGGEPYIELRETYYNDKGVPVGHCSPCTCSETVEGMVELLYWHSLALSKPILTEADFTGQYKDDDDDDDDDDEDNEDNDWDTKELFK